MQPCLDALERSAGYAEEHQTQKLPASAHSLTSWLDTAHADRQASGSDQTAPERRD